MVKGQFCPSRINFCFKGVEKILLTIFFYVMCRKLVGELVSNEQTLLPQKIPDFTATLGSEINP